jgi:hypothetical protein
MVAEDSHPRDEPFLLIFCTGRIVTTHSVRYRQIHQVFQHMAECITASLPAREAACSYLRTVIVTAAVYRGFRSSLAALPLTFRHRAGVSPYTSPYGFAETCVFSKQSVGPLNCNPQRLRR